MSARVGPPCPGAFEGGSGALKEIDRALAVIGAVHWMENVSTAAQPRDRRQSDSTDWQPWSRLRPPRDQWTRPESAGSGHSTGRP